MVELSCIKSGKNKIQELEICKTSTFATNGRTQLLTPNLRLTAGKGIRGGESPNFTVKGTLVFCMVLRYAENQNYLLTADSVKTI